METNILDKIPINFIFKANIVFVSKESEDRDRISEIAGIELLCIVYT
jgi:hypothetical protein